MFTNRFRFTHINWWSNDIEYPKPQKPPSYIPIGTSFFCLIDLLWKRVYIIMYLAVQYLAVFSSTVISTLGLSWHFSSAENLVLSCKRSGIIFWQNQPPSRMDCWLLKPQQRFEEPSPELGSMMLNGFDGHLDFWQPYWVT